VTLLVGSSVTHKIVPEMMYICWVEC